MGLFKEASKESRSIPAHQLLAFFIDPETS